MQHTGLAKFNLFTTDFRENPVRLCSGRASRNRPLFAPTGLSHVAEHVLVSLVSTNEEIHAIAEQLRSPFDTARREDVRRALVHHEVLL